MFNPTAIRQAGKGGISLADGGLALTTAPESGNFWKNGHIPIPLNQLRIYTHLRKCSEIHNLEFIILKLGKWNRMVLLS